jgi:hypothetical protein
MQDHYRSLAAVLQLLPHQLVLLEAHLGAYQARMQAGAEPSPSALRSSGFELAQLPSGVEGRSVVAASGMLGCAAEAVARGYPSAAGAAVLALGVALQGVLTLLQRGQLEVGTALYLVEMELLIQSLLDYGVVTAGT